MSKIYQVKVASYKNSKSTFAKFIRLQQKVQGFEPRFADLSHSEIVFCHVDDKDVTDRLYNIGGIGFKQHTEYTPPIIGDLFQQHNLWFSSSENDGGTRFKFIEDDKSHWVYHNIEITKQEYLNLLDFYIGINDLPYAWWSILATQGLKTLWFKSYDRLFCSESVLMGIQTVLKIMCGIDAVTCNPALLAWGLENNICRFDKRDLQKVNYIIKD